MYCNECVLNPSVIIPYENINVCLSELAYCYNIFIYHIWYHDYFLVKWIKYINVHEELYSCTCWFCSCLVFSYSSFLGILCEWLQNHPCFFCKYNYCIFLTVFKRSYLLNKLFAVYIKLHDQLAHRVSNFTRFRYASAGVKFQ